MTRSVQESDGADPNLRAFLEVRQWRRFSSTQRNWTFLQANSIDNCSVTHIELATSRPIAHLLNDIVHLEQIDIDTLSMEAGS